MELATRLDANLVHNPLSLCLERNQAGDVFAPLLGLPREPAACTPRRLWRHSESANACACTTPSSLLLFVTGTSF